MTDRCSSLCHLQEKTCSISGDGKCPVAKSEPTDTDWQEIDRLAKEGREDLAWKIRTGQVSAETVKLNWEKSRQWFKGDWEAWNSLTGEERNYLLFPDETRLQIGTGPAE